VGIKLLFADGSETVRQVARAVLEKEEVEVRFAADGQEALDAVNSEKPDVVIADNGLAEIGGLELCRRVKAFSQTPFILLAGEMEHINESEADDAGVDGQLKKPFKADELMDAMRKAVGEGAQAGMLALTPEQIVSGPEVSGLILTPEEAVARPEPETEAAGAKEEPLILDAEKFPVLEAPEEKESEEREGEIVLDVGEIEIEPETEIPEGTEKGAEEIVFSEPPVEAAVAPSEGKPASDFMEALAEKVENKVMSEVEKHMEEFLKKELQSVIRESVKSAIEEFYSETGKPGMNDGSEPAEK
jgi:CheY-like chemotaxis protein